MEAPELGGGASRELNGRTSRTPKHQELCSQQINHITVLIQHSAPNRDHALLGFGTRRHDFDNFAFNMQNIARTRGLRPGDFAAKADEAMRNRQAEQRLCSAVFTGAPVVNGNSFAALNAKPTSAAKTNTRTESSDR